MNKVYMKVTRDEYSLPLAVAGSIAELAELCGVAKTTVESELCRIRQGKRKYPRYVVVEVPDGF